MEIERSNEVRGQVYVYRFEPWECILIAKVLKPEIRKWEKKIKKVEDDPENEGQATFSLQIRDLYFEMKAIEKIVTEFETYKPVIQPKNKKPCEVLEIPFD